ncbi:unnamed protein product [Periconia digitata]|uniref:Poly(A) RNA polymerase mitochondrial-like central palm domain-containing protein n=1 Tax=Periconia digitata TaxID=1303443 RepID=A0A9W4XNH4_9PLEO|nr:unnamed protein product [Periconia digitata]
MKLHRVCRSNHRFAPATALWRHFVLPYRPQSQCFSSAAVASEPRAGQPQDHAAAPKLRIRRIIRPTTYSEADTRQVNPLHRKALAAFQGNTDYEGEPIPAHPVQTSQAPWDIVYEKLDNRQKLSSQISKFYQYSRPDTREAVARKNLIAQVRTHAQSSLPNHRLEVFGSERTGLALPLSDIDLRLVTLEELEAPRGSFPPDPLDKLELVKLLEKLKQRVSNNPAYFKTEIRYARYPLLHTVDRETGLPIQIVCSNDSSRSRAIMQQYLNEFPYLREVFVLVKTSLDVRGLSEVYLGGLGSYSVFMMIVAALKHTKLLSTQHDDAASSLLRFLDFWAKVDLKEGIAIEPPIRFNKKQVLVLTKENKALKKTDRKKRQPPWMLCLQDPADETNDLGGKAYCIKHVIESIKQMNAQINDLLAGEPVANLLGCMVGDFQTRQYMMRKRLRARGAKIMQDSEGLLAAAKKSRRPREEPISSIVDDAVSPVSETQGTD